MGHCLQLASFGYIWDSIENSAEGGLRLLGREFGSEASNGLDQPLEIKRIVGLRDDAKNIVDRRAGLLGGEIGL